MSNHPDSTIINTLPWREEYFKKQWDDNNGRSQTHGFMEALVENLPDAECDFLSTNNVDILDWGCAFGDGVDVVAKKFPRCRVFGSDFSVNAVAGAKIAYPQYEFLHTGDGNIERPFDVIITSNCLEHFENPLEIMQEHLSSCRQLYIILVPYKEIPFCESHAAQFREECFPERLSGFTRICCKVVEVDKKIWPGKQILVIYGSACYLHERNRCIARMNEKSKWDSFYSSLPSPQLINSTHNFSNEVATRVKELLPNGGKIMEVGCGGGEQSLALARTGMFELTLVDFSEEALKYAKKLFAMHNVHANFQQGDAFASTEAEYDLVFNAGVLEHYITDEQVAFLKSMAGRSKKYVLVLVPNAQCYWYWIWRNQKASHSEWPYGKEMPLLDLSEIFKNAGLNFIGQMYLGSIEVESFINGVSGMDDETRNRILSIHRSGMIPDCQCSYLVAGLGIVGDKECQTATGWTSPIISNEHKSFKMMAAVSDALACRISSEAQLKIMEKRLVEAANKSTMLENRLASIAEIESVTQSRTWHLVTCLTNIRSRLMPNGSLREKFARMIYSSTSKVLHLMKSIYAKCFHSHKSN